MKNQSSNEFSKRKRTTNPFRRRNDVHHLVGMIRIDTSPHHLSIFHSSNPPSSTMPATSSFSIYKLIVNYQQETKQFQPQSF